MLVKNVDSASAWASITKGRKYTFFPSNMVNHILQPIAPITQSIINIITHLDLFYINFQLDSSFLKFLIFYKEDYLH